MIRHLSSPFVAFLAAVVSAASVSGAQVLMDEPPEAIDGVGVDERLGERVPHRLEFVDIDGERLPLGTHFDGERPVVLVLGYYGCPVVCPTIFRLMTECFREMPYTVGEDFKVMAVSIDPTENAVHALAERDKQLSAYDPEGQREATPETIASGWRFLTGDESEISQLAEAVGYRYKLLENGEYSHPVVLCVLSPDGMITRYIYGFEYDPFQVRMSLLDASDGKIAQSLGDRIMQFCYTFDPNAGEYTVQAFTIMRIGAGLTVVGLVALIGVMFAGERLRKNGGRPGDGSGGGSGTGGVVAAA